MTERVLILSCYENGHPPLSAATTAAALRAAGLDSDVLDLSVDALDPERVRAATRIAFSAPMHLSLVLATAMVPRIRSLGPQRPIAAFGDQAWLAGERLATLVDAVFRDGAELMAWAGSSSIIPPGLVPYRAGIADLSRYARFERDGRARLTATTEASRGCKHRCRHCPIPAAGRTRVETVPIDVVAADVRALVGAGAEHIRFADPDFLNLPGHSLAVLERLRADHPALGFGITAKVSHLQRQRALLPRLAELGVELVVTAIESLSDTVLEKLDKGHTRRDIEALPALMDAAGLPFRPTFVPFTPWTTRMDLLDLVDWIESEDLDIDPIQLSIRLLLPPGSALIAAIACEPPTDDELLHRWMHPDPALDQLQARLAALAAGGGDDLQTRMTSEIRRRLQAPAPARRRRRAAAARYSEAWFC